MNIFWSKFPVIILIENVIDEMKKQEDPLSINQTLSSSVQTLVEVKSVGQPLSANFV